MHKVQPQPLNVSNCSGNGTAKVILSPGSGANSSGALDTGATSADVTIDNINPTVSVGSPSPTTGDSSTSFDFPVTFSGAGYSEFNCRKHYYK